MEKRRATRFVLAVALAGLAGAAMAASVEHVGTLQVQRHGDHGRPVILIPGLECGPWEWKDTIAQLEKNHVVYAVTLAGFDGMPAPAKMTGLLDQADASLLALIEQQHIDKPALVGHSIGGTLALRFAGEHAKLLSGVVAVDGLPIYPGMELLGEAKRQQVAARWHAQIDAMTPAQYKTAALGYMQHIGVVAPGLAAEYAPMIARSDAKATAEYMAEDMDADFRPLLKHADVPILEIVPYYAPDAVAYAARSKQPVPSAAQKAAYYQSLLANAPDAKVASIAPARHFAMLDQPAKFQQALAGFLNSL